MRLMLEFGDIRFRPSRLNIATENAPAGGSVVIFTIGFQEEGLLQRKQ